MTSETSGIPQLEQGEAQDLATKLKNLDAQLSDNQKKFLHFAVNRLSQKNAPEGSDVQGYDYAAVYDTGYYDVNTGLEIYEVDYYNNAGYYEGTTYVED